MSAHEQSPSDLPTLLTKTTSPTRPKHSTRRSITETSSAAFPKLHRPHHHHGRTHHKTLKEKPGDVHSGYTHTQGARNIWASNSSGEKERGKSEKSEGFGNGSISIGTGMGVIDGTKSEGVTPEQSRGPSRRASLLGRSEEIFAGLGDGKAEREKVVREGELEREKERAGLRATGLRNALSSLNTLSNNTTRRLDNTYYSVLEKLSALSTTVSSMKELSWLMREVHSEFLEESEEVVEEVEIALEGFDGFDDQQTRIEGLAKRVEAGRTKIETLGTRVEAVRLKVDGWEKVEVEWQESTRRRLRMLWIVIAVCGVIFSGLMVFQYTPARTQGPGVIKGWDPNLIGGDVKDRESMKNETFSLTRPTVEALEKMKEVTKNQEELGDEPRLRIFDEL